MITRNWVETHAESAYDAVVAVFSRYFRGQHLGFWYEQWTSDLSVMEGDQPDTRDRYCVDVTDLGVERIKELVDGLRGAPWP